MDKKLSAHIGALNIDINIILWLFIQRRKVELYYLLCLGWVNKSHCCCDA
jgi:hypothetical protein